MTKEQAEAMLKIRKITIRDFIRVAENLLERNESEKLEISDLEDIERNLMNHYKNEVIENHAG